jgi:hypothetical protein
MGWKSTFTSSFVGSAFFGTSMGLPTTNNRGSGKGSGVLHRKNRVKRQSRIRAHKSVESSMYRIQGHPDRQRSSGETARWTGPGSASRQCKGGRCALPAPAPEEEGREPQGARQPGVPLSTGLPVPGTTRQAGKGVSQGQTKADRVVPTAKGIHRDLHQTASQMGNAAGLRL